MVMNHLRCRVLYLEAQGVKINVKSLSPHLTHILFFTLTFALFYHMYLLRHVSV